MLEKIGNYPYIKDFLFIIVINKLTICKYEKKNLRYIIYECNVLIQHILLFNTTLLIITEIKFCYK